MPNTQIQAPYFHTVQSGQTQGFPVVHGTMTQEQHIPLGQNLPPRPNGITDQQQPGFSQEFGNTDQSPLLKI